MLPDSLTPGPDFASDVPLEPIAAVLIALVVLGLYFMRRI